MPLRCEEYMRKKRSDAARSMYENRLAEALIRFCYKCRKPFVKTDGCNKITWFVSIDLYYCEHRLDYSVQRIDPVLYSYCMRVHGVYIQIPNGLGFSSIIFSIIYISLMIYR